MSLRDKVEHAIQNQPCTVKDLKARFGGDRGADRKVMEALDSLVHDAVICQRSGVFFTVRSGRAEKALLCKVVKLGKNFAFVMLEDETSDIFIPGRFTRGAMPGDEVLVEKFEHPRVEGSDEGAILAVLTEKNDLVGTVRRIEGRLKFVPDDCPAISMQLMRDCEGGAKDGDKVAVEILMRGNRQEDHRVGVAMRFGSSDEAKRCAKALLYARDIHTRFPDKVREEAKKFENMTVSEKDCEGRMDLRALPIFTIDSAETKDIDDAISLTRTPEGGFELGVHIADVSNYVKPGSELNEEAFNRATSVYYADQVVPMLPKSLSNGICSLNEKELRLAFSCLMRLDKDGNLTMIEEFMLLANQCAAHFARVKQIPFVYRVHEEPNGEKLERLHALLQACGINDHFAKDVPTPKELSAILEGVRGTSFEEIINTGMLRCMSKACYEEKPKGHYGLVLKDYAHFTSPIRRYPDLAIHRIMTDLLSGTDKETMAIRYTDFAAQAAKQSSEREVIAVQIERKAEDCYKAEYARRHLGECYEGIISGVTQRGLFVELENGVEGFVPASSLTATGTTLTEGIRLSDPVSGKNWNLGDSMMITIVRADVNLGKVDFEVAPENKQ